VFESGPAERLLPFFERMSEPRPLRPRSKQEWLERRGTVRYRALNALGLSPMPDRLPLEIHYGGLSQREGYRVERIYWQTWPKVWASGWLYMPDEVEGKVPAVLNPHGHLEHGARAPEEQSRLISLAKLGYVALAVDSVHLYDYPTGFTPLSVMTFANMRAVDLLASLPEVDRDRIGITGASGGAQQAMYLLAVEDRVKAAALAVYVSHFRRILSPEKDHCACNHVPGIMRYTDGPELCGVASPRALLFLTATGDWTAPFPQHELGELRALYRLWGQPDRLEHLQFEVPHGYHREMREAAYGFFERELRGNRHSGPIPEPEHQVEEPEFLCQLDSPPEEDRGGEGILEWYAKRVTAIPPQLESRQSRRNYQDRAREELLDLLGGAPEPVTLETTERPTPNRLPPVRGTQRPSLVSFRSERDVRVPAVLAPGSGSGPWPVLIALHPEGKSAALATGTVGGLQEAGFAVLAPDVRFCGELRRDWTLNCIAWGRPEAGLAAWDLRACVDWLLEQEDVDPDGIALLGEGSHGVTALIAAGLDERITAVIADCCETTYRDGGEGLPVIPNILRVADVPQLASLAAPRPVWLYRVPEDRVGFPSRRYYDWTRRTFQSLGEQEALHMTARGLPDPAALAEWLRRRMRRARR
jgi:cephalosporin-C deacetylase-like acetyl esterase